MKVVTRWNLRLCAGRTLITWQNCFITHRQGNVKSLMKALRLHIIVIERSQYMFNLSRSYIEANEAFASVNFCNAAIKHICNVKSNHILLRVRFKNSNTAATLCCNYQKWTDLFCKRFDNNCYHLQCIAFYCYALKMITVVIETFARCQLYRLLWTDLCF